MLPHSPSLVQEQTNQDNMEATGKFSRLRQRDVSVPMLRVKMSRRRSQSQKENRERAVNSRRQLDQVPELDSTLEASIMAVNISNVKETAPLLRQSAKDLASAQRLEMLKRWKETKSLIKEKEKREKERKGVFKVGLFRPTDYFSLKLPVAKPCEAAVKVPQTCGTRLTKLDEQPVVGRMTRSRTALARAKVQPAATRGNAVPRAGPVLCAATVSVSNVVKPAGGRTTRGNAKPVAPSTGRGKNKAVVVKTGSAVVDETAAVKQGAESIHRKEEAELVAESDTLAPRPATEGTSSFAPKGFVFETPAGLSTFKFDLLTPRSVDTFLRPSSMFNFPPVLPLEAETSGPSPPKSPQRSPRALTSPQESQHDVPYFRSQVTTVTARLTSLSQLWEVKVDDDSIPEEMRDRMRTAVGQARLLMKERFGQFLGLVDDGELGRGEKPTTCNDLQGFWDMVYFQVEDVFRKFDAIKEAEARCWVEENKPARKKIVKKPPPAAAPKGVGTNAEAKSRLAAVKAAMKAKLQRWRRVPRLLAQKTTPASRCLKPQQLPRPQTL